MNIDYKKSLNINSAKDNQKINYDKSPLIINDNYIKIGFNKIYIDDIEVGSFVIQSIGNFKDTHNKKTYINSIFLQGGFIIKNDYRYKGVGRETIQNIFKISNTNNIFLYAVDWQGGVEFWKKIGGEVIFRDNDKELNLIKIQNNLK